MVLLEAPVDALLERIRARGREFEQRIDAGYLKDLALAIRDLYSSADNVIRVDTSDFTWLNDNLDALARDLAGMVRWPLPPRS